MPIKQLLIEITANHQCSIKDDGQIPTNPKAIKKAQRKKLKNLRWAIYKWLKFFYPESKDPEGINCNENFSIRVFNDKMNVFNCHLRNKSKSGISNPDTARKIQNLVNEAALFYQSQEIIGVDFEYNSFQELLRTSLKTRKITIQNFARKVGVSESVVSKWLNGVAVPQKSDEITEKAAKVLKLSKERLEKSLPFLGEVQKVKTTASVPRFTKGLNLASHLVAQLEELKQFKMSPVLKSGLKRDGVWVEESKKNYFSLITSILKFAAAPKQKESYLSGLGMQQASFGLDILLDMDVMKSFFEFRQIRHKQKALLNDEEIFSDYPSSTYNDLTMLISLVQSGTGFFNQHYNFLKPKGSFQDWKTKCEEAYENFSFWRREWNSNSQIAETGRQNYLAPILKKMAPRFEIFEIMRNMLQNLRLFPLQAIDGQKSSASLTKEYLLQKQMLAQIAIACNVPLRRKGFSKLRVDDLEFDEEKGCFVLSVRKEILKNGKKRKDLAAVTKLPLNLSAAEGFDVTDILNDYLKNVMPRLEIEGGLLFSSVNSGLMGNYTQRFGTTGLRLGYHSFRYVVATHLYKNYSNGLELAALYLLDTTPIVQDYYVYVDEQEKVERVMANSAPLKELRFSKIDVEGPSKLQSDRSEASPGFGRDQLGVTELLLAHGGIVGFMLLPAEYQCLVISSLKPNDRVLLTEALQKAQREPHFIALLAGPSKDSRQ